MVDMRDISKQIFDRMYVLKMSYSDLSKLTGISKSTLQRYVTGETEKMPLPNLELIANALSLSPSVLMGWEESPAPAPSAQPQLAPMEQSVLDGFRQLNEEGQDKVKSYIDDLLRVDIYKKGCAESFVVSKNA